jgi:hypothetical protein
LRVEAGAAYIPFDSGTWQIRTQQRGTGVTFESHLERGWFDLAAQVGALTLRPTGDPENFLRVAYAQMGLARGTLLLHAAGVIRGGRGYVFFGPSGSGKTTVSNLSMDAVVLSDDLVMLRVDGERVRLFGVPFRGELIEAPRTNAHAELRALHLLVKDSEHRVAAVPESEAIARLCACVPFVLNEPQQAARVVALCAALERRVPIAALHFRRDAGFWEVVNGD